MISRRSICGGVSHTSAEVVQKKTLVMGWYIECMSIRRDVKWPLVVALVLAITLPLALYAQSDTELRDTIRRALLADPRSAAFSEADRELMVDILTMQAQDQGVTTEDLNYRPGSTFGEGAENAVEYSWCGNMPSTLCAMTQALGFGDGDNTIPVALWGSGMVLLFVLGTMIEIRHIKHKRAAHMPPPAPTVGE
jgi:hypothetical protein